VPITLGIAAVAFTGASAFFGVQAKNAEQNANQAHFYSDAVSYGADANMQALLANVGFAIAGAAAIAAVIAFFVLN
jgi:hypothetical protein